MWLPMAMYSEALEKSTALTWPSGVFAVGQLAKTVPEERWRSLSESALVRLASARISEVGLYRIVVTLVVRFRMAFSGLRGALSERPEEKAVSALYRLTIPDRELCETDRKI